MDGDKPKVMLHIPQISATVVNMPPERVKQLEDALVAIAETTEAFIAAEIERRCPWVKFVSSEAVDTEDPGDDDSEGEEWKNG